MPTIEFVVEGNPVSKGRPRFSKNSTYTPDKTRNYERAVAYRAREAMCGKKPIDVVCGMELKIYMPIPKSFKGLEREKALAGSLRPICKSDMDNNIKAVADACNKIVYVDDNRICDLSASRYYSMIPRVEVRVNWEE